LTETGEAFDKFRSAPKKCTRNVRTGVRCSLEIKDGTVLAEDEQSWLGRGRLGNGSDDVSDPNEVLST